MTPTEIRARVLHRDRLVVIIDKPAGLPVHAGPRGGPNLELYLDALRFGYKEQPSLAHRLDRDTSGCLVLGRNRRALARLGRMFQGGRVEKVYWAVTDGVPEAPEGRVDAPLAKRTPGRGWKMVVDPAGQAAVTDWRVLDQAGGRAWIECRPRTGRTHQIRVHMAHLGCPLVGDPVYAEGVGDAFADEMRTKLGPMLLHARAITLPLYPDQPPVEAVAPVPGHMRRALEEVGMDGAAEDAFARRQRAEALAAAETAPADEEPVEKLKSRRGRGFEAPRGPGSGRGGFGGR
jgi:RluA family pseudouridine synthase